MRLPAREKSLTIDLHCRQSLCQYEYRLKQEYAVDWKPFTNQVMLNYENLSGNEYVFQVRRANSQPFIEQRIFIENAFWQQWWFIPSLFLYAVFIVGIILFLFFQYRLRQFMRLQQTRDRIARDLHDDMGSYLSSISILSQTAHRSAPIDAAKTQATLTRIGQTARQVMDSMGDIVWSINPDHDSMAQVVARMTDVAASLFTDSDVDYHIDVADEVRSISLSAECRRDFFLVYKEAITNAARYAQARRVRVGLRRETGWLVLTVQDNGRGFDLQSPARQNATGGNGLRNMHNRAALLHGTLDIESAPGQGTRVAMRFPV